MPNIEAEKRLLYLLKNEAHPVMNVSIDLTKLTYGSQKKVWWVCAEGHEWETSVGSRVIRKYNCPYCNGQKTIVGVNDLVSLSPDVAKDWHPTKNGSLLASMVMNKSHKKVWWVCSERHEWEAAVSGRTNSHSGCPFCSGRNKVVGVDDVVTLYPFLLKDLHPTLANVSDLVGKSSFSREKFWWVCSEGHSYQQSIMNHVSRNHGCPVCSGNVLLAGFNDLLTKNSSLASEWNHVKNRSLLPSQVTSSTTQQVWWVCSEGHEWEAAVYSRTASNGCPRCSQLSSGSKGENELRTYVESLGVQVVVADRNILRGAEIDVLIPDFGLGIEFNGVYWHSESTGKGRSYRKDKWELARDNGVQLIQIWEDDWSNPDRQKIIKSMISYKVGLGPVDRVYARDTKFVEIDYKDASEFLMVNHIQGKANGAFYYALKSVVTDKVVAVMVIAVIRKGSEVVYNISRYATACNVVGGFTKILKNVEKSHVFNSWVTFSDNMVSDGDLYANNGFLLDGRLKPDYMYVVGGVRKHKFSYRVRRFRDDPAFKFREGMSGSELAAFNNLSRVWDAGKVRWVKKLK